MEFSQYHVILREQMGIIGSMIYLLMQSLFGHGVILFPLIFATAAIAMILDRMPTGMQKTGIVLGVLVGTLAADAISLAQMIGSGELYEYTYGDIPLLILFLALNDAEYLMATLSNVGMGLLFAALGVFGLLRKTKKEVAGIRVIDLSSP